MTNWIPIAQRIVRGVGVSPGELILIREESGRFDLLLEVMLAIEKAGATPLPQLTPAGYMTRLWQTASADYLSKWDKIRREWLLRADRIIVLAGDQPDFSAIPTASFATWQEAEARLTDLEEERKLPYLLTAVPTPTRAHQLNLSPAAFENLLLSALAVPLEQLQREIDRLRQKTVGARKLTIESGAGCQLHLELADRPWLADDGYIDADDRARGAIVSNLPAGSIYTTVREDRSSGTLFLPTAGPSRDVVLTFENGRINPAKITAATNPHWLPNLLAQHSGEPGRISHIGIGLNPALRQPIGWTLVDEHVHGHLFLALGENRYMGGSNIASLNIDFPLPNATLLADNNVLVKNGRIP